MNFYCLIFETFCFNLLSVLNMSQRQNVLIPSFFVLLNCTWRQNHQEVGKKLVNFCEFLRKILVCPK